MNSFVVLTVILAICSTLCFVNLTRINGGQADGSARSQRNHSKLIVELMLLVHPEVHERYWSPFRVRQKKIGPLMIFVNEMTSQLDFYVVLTGYKLMQYPILEPSYWVTLLNQFESYVRTNLSREVNITAFDHVTIILPWGYFKPNGIGATTRGRLCKERATSSIITDFSEPYWISETLAHELGHSIGMTHDNRSECHCPDYGCIMHSGSVFDKRWSNCSESEMNEAKAGLDCLRNFDPETVVQPICGNQILEPGEECDCGMPHRCDDTFICCHKCKISYVKKCRPMNYSCDISEFCTGRNTHCPPDRWALPRNECLAAITSTQPIETQKSSSLTGSSLSGLPGSRSWSSTTNMAAVATTNLVLVIVLQIIMFLYHSSFVLNI